jgi:hypothetical protein
MENIKDIKKDGTSTENKIQQQMFVWFQNNYSLKDNVKGIFASIPNDSKDAKEQMRKKATGMKVGHSDFNIYMNGRCYFFEVKTPTGVQSDSQKRFESEVKSLGFEYYIVRSLDEFKNIIHYLESL